MTVPLQQPVLQPQTSFHVDDKTRQLIQTWKEKLGNLTELVLPTDYPRPIPHRVVEAETSWDIPETTAFAIIQLSMYCATQKPSLNGNHASPFTILLAAFAILLHKYTGEEDICVGSSSLSTNPLVLRLKTMGDSCMDQVIENVLQARLE
jgi:L-aminoadipate-semialdehyde dehydrogenase